MHKKLTSAMLIATFLTPMAMAMAKETKEKRIVGQLEYIQVEQAELAFLTRIDTGAATTSMHAFDLKVDNDAGEMDKNIGKMLTFTTMNEGKAFHTGKAKIVDVTGIRNSQGREDRYVVELDLKWHGETKTVRVNLRNRTKMDYKLLIGRNWLSGDYLVDVDIEEPKK